VVEEVWLDHPVHLQVLEMVGDPLEEPLSNVGVVLGRIRYSVMHGVAALRPAAVRDARAVVLVIGVTDRKFTVKRMVDSEKPGSNVDLVIVVRTPAVPVLTNSRAIDPGDVGNHKRG
jgi:hypothetical protein